MSVRLRLSSGSHLLYVALGLAERLSLFEALLADVGRTGRRLIAIVDPELEEVFRTAARLARVRPRQLTVRTAADLAQNGDWQVMCAEMDQLVADAERNATSWRLDEPESETVLFCDLDRVFERCEAASEMMSIVYALHHAHAVRRRCVVEAISVETIPRSIPAEFFDVHTQWAFSSQAIPAAHDGDDLDAASVGIALDTPEFRNQFLALARADTESALQLVPRLLADYRRGFLLVDQRFRVKYASPRAAALLRRSSDEIADRPLSSCVDGVDLVTVRRECVRLAGGRESPFVVSWRLAPGNYEPREVTVDAITSEHRTVGYIISLAPVESVRGPRAVYRQLKEDQLTGPAGLGDDDDLSAQETLNESLQGTQITRREHEVLLLILSHKSNRDIARELNIAEVTVKKHLTSIYRKLRITNRAELVRSFVSPLSDGSTPVGGSQ